MEIYHNHKYIPHGKFYRKFRTSPKEVKDLLKAWVALSLAFSILRNGLSFSLDFLIVVLISGITVGFGFLFHELGHKYMAQKYKCWAEFRASDEMLLFAILMSFMGFLFAAPGAVMIMGNVSIKKNGHISAAGPAMNFIMSAIFAGLMFIGNPLLTAISFYGFFINSWLGLFNLIPFGNFDGIKIARWSLPVYFSMVAVGISLVFFVPRFLG